MVNQSERGRFKSRLEAGSHTEEYLAAKLREAGIDVEKPEYPERMPTSYYTKHQVDLVANGYILEVKGRSVLFHDAASYPFDTIFVEGVSGFDAKENVPDFYVNVSNLTGAIIYLDVQRTWDSWTVERISGKYRKSDYDMYVSRADQWGDFDELVKALGGV